MRIRRLESLLRCKRVHHRKMGILSMIPSLERSLLKIIIKHIIYFDRFKLIITYLVKADSGNIRRKPAHEFQALAEFGEDTCYCVY